MKITTTLAGASSTLLLAGCGSVATLGQLPPNCTPSTSITVEHGSGRLEIDNECIGVTAGSSVTFVFAPAPALNTVRTKFRGLGNRWLDKSNSDPSNPGTIVLPVPSNKGGSDDDNAARRNYKYEIHVQGVGVLDPHIVVE